MKDSKKHILFTILLVAFSFTAFCQKDSVSVNKTPLQIKYNPLSPSKAAFYSAIFPGAGQIYNNKYWWQLPVIYGGLGTSIYFYIDNNKNYHKYRNAYRLRKAGLPDEFTDAQGRQLISNAGLENAQRQLRRNRDLSLLSAVLIYALQIVEASVTAHLLQFDTNDNLSLKPTLIPNENFNELPKVGLSVKYNF
ncbi:MAG: hypothetical protein KGV59_02360 [Tenacibaculum sp.]|nr:hypothetical protein [Tenacibaculum sp.]